jgi:hypothetical protein
MNQESFLKAAASYAASAERSGAHDASVLNEEDDVTSNSDGTSGSSWGSPGHTTSSIDQLHPHDNQWIRQSRKSRVSIIGTMRATRTELGHVDAALETNTLTATQALPFLEPVTPLHSTSSSSMTDSSLHQKAMSVFRSYWLFGVFLLVLFGLTVLTWFYIKKHYVDPAILTGRFLASITIVSFSVFLLPFVRAIQGQMYDKLAEFASFFNPHLHKALGLVLITAGTLHGILWNVATWRSCEGTWCQVEQEGYSDPIVQASCIRTFCHDQNLMYDPLARGGMPSFNSVFTANVPLNLQKSQAAVRSFYYGYFCWLLFAVIGIFTLPRIRRRNFELFYYSHHLFIIAIPIFFLHCWTIEKPSVAVLVMVVPCGLAVLLYTFDKFVSIFLKRFTSAKVDAIFYSDDRILELRFRPIPAWPLLRNPSLWFSKTNLMLDAPSHCTFAPGMKFSLHVSLNVLSVMVAQELTSILTALLSASSNGTRSP